MGLDEKLWDILEDRVGDLDLDEEGAAVDRKKHTPAQFNPPFLCFSHLHYEQKSKFKTAYSKMLILYKIAYYDLFFKKQLIQNILFMQNNLLRFLFKNCLFKIAYLCKTTYYDFFLKNRLFKLAYLCKPT